jgi:hypothetical protein
MYQVMHHLPVNPHRLLYQIKHHLQVKAVEEEEEEEEEAPKKVDQEMVEHL